MLETLAICEQMLEILDAGYWIPDTGFWILDAGYWMTKKTLAVNLTTFRIP